MKNNTPQPHKFAQNKDSDSPHPVCLVCDEDGFAEGHASERLNILTPQPDWEERFIDKFCNDHNGEVRFLRGIFYDEKDGSDKIMEFISQEIQRAREEGHVLGFLMGYKQAVQELQNKITKIKEEMK